MKDQEIFEREANKLPEKLLCEINRLLNSGMTDQYTSNSGLIRVALDNIAECYSKSHDYNNIKLI